MKYKDVENDLYVVIDAQVLRQIEEQAVGGFPNEDGGMLVGRYSDDKKTVFVTRVIAPTEKLSTRTGFERKVEGMEGVWEELSKGGLRYVGEWHSHTNGTTQYRGTDFAAMKDIEKEVTIENPLLVIVGVRRGGVDGHAVYRYSEEKLIKYEKMIDLKELFGSMQHEMLASLQVNREFISHLGSMGDATEERWIEFLNTYLPDRYDVDKAIVIDAQGNVSDQIDIVVYDNLYTPFIFNKDGFKYVPAESVYAVFEVKQDLEGNIEYAADKVESVRRLQRTSVDMVSSGRVTKARLLTKIIGGILTTTNSIAKQETIESHLRALKGYRTLDMGCCVASGSFFVDYEEIDVERHDYSGDIASNRADIEKVYDSRKVTTIHFSKPEVSLFTFFLQLVSYLKSIGTVGAINVNAYLKAIDESVDEKI